MQISSEKFTISLGYYLTENYAHYVHFHEIRMERTYILSLKLCKRWGPISWDNFKNMDRLQPRIEKFHAIGWISIIFNTDLTSSGKVSAIISLTFYFQFYDIKYQGIDIDLVNKYLHFFILIVKIVKKRFMALLTELKYKLIPASEYHPYIMC